MSTKDDVERYRKHNVKLRDAAAAIAYNLRVLRDAVGPNGESPLPTKLKRYVDAAIRWSEVSESLNPIPDSVYDLLLECAAHLRETKPTHLTLALLERVDRVAFPKPRK